jgi:hypothetical protein
MSSCFPSGGRAAAANRLRVGREEARGRGLGRVEDQDLERPRVEQTGLDVERPGVGRPLEPQAVGPQRRWGDRGRMRSVRVRDQDVEHDGILVLREPAERDVGAVGRVEGIEVVAAADHQLLRLAGDRVQRHDVPIGRVDDLSVPCRPERRWKLGLPRARDERERRDEQGDDEQGDGHRAPPGRGGDGGGRRDVGHGEPPSCEGPRRPLAMVRRGREGLRPVVGGRPQVQVLEDGGEVAIEAGVRGHATCPPEIGAGAGSGSAAVDRRIAARALWSRDFAVPRGMPRDAATSGSGIPRR